MTLTPAGLTLARQLSRLPRARSTKVSVDSCVVPVYDGIDLVGTRGSQKKEDRMDDTKDMVPRPKVYESPKLITLGTIADVTASRYPTQGPMGPVHDPRYPTQGPMGPGFDPIS